MKERALPRPRGAHDGDDLSGSDREIDPFQNSAWRPRRKRLPDVLGQQHSRRIRCMFPTRTDRANRIEPRGLPRRVQRGQQADRQGGSRDPDEIERLHP